MPRLTLLFSCTLALVACDARPVGLQGSDGASLAPSPDTLQTPPVCQGASPCEADEVCVPSACGTSIGTCVKRPTCAAEEYAAVCSCEGKSYRSDCGRVRAGEALKHDGVCVTDVRVLVDKTTYQAGEKVTVQVENHSEMRVYLAPCPKFEWQRQEAGAWKSYVSKADCLQVSVDLAPGQRETSVVTPSKGGLWRLVRSYTYPEPIMGGLHPRAIGGKATSEPFTVLPSKNECGAIAVSYESALAKAKTCHCDMGLCAPGSCQEAAPSSLWCGCDTWVNEKTELAPIAQSWKDTLCPRILTSLGLDSECVLDCRLSTGVCQANPSAPSSAGTCADF